MTIESAIALASSILIIDDSPDNLRVLSRTLTAHGYAVRCVTNSSMAFVSISNRPPDLILLDIRMPGMNGYEVCQTLKQNTNTQDIPVIFLSALDDVEDIVKAFQVGGIDYITKPFQAEEVLARIRNQLTIQKLRRQLFTQNGHLLQEIEDRKKIEHALFQEIQRRILIEASLQDAKNAAEAANYVRSEFLAQISHELRTPLNIILGFTTVMKGESIKGESSLTQEHQKYLITIDENARHLLKLINNVLSITRTASSQFTLSHQEFDLHYLLNAVVSLWQLKAITEGLQFEFQQAADVPQYIQADESKLRQIMMNLLDNAIRLSKSGTVTVRVRGEHTPSVSTNNSLRLVIEVQSSDSELVFNKLDAAFQMFAQAGFDQELAQELGLSLLLIRQLAQLMGGDLILSSSPEQGTVFIVHLSVHRADSSLAFRQAQPTVPMVQSTLIEGTLTLEVLQTVMPSDWLVQLHDAAVKGFDQQILQLLQEIPPSHITLAQTLELWTRDFQFDRIVEITKDRGLNKIDNSL